jgi:hypothetical protein
MAEIWGIGQIKEVSKKLSKEIDIKILSSHYDLVETQHSYMQWHPI